MAAQDSFVKSLDVTMDSQKSSGKIFRLEEVKEHSSPDDMWMAIHNKVYDITKFLEEVNIRCRRGMNI